MMSVWIRLGIWKSEVDIMCVCVIMAMTIQEIVSVCMFPSSWLPCENVLQKFFLHCLGSTSPWMMMTWRRWSFTRIGAFACCTLSSCRYFPWTIVVAVVPNCYSRKECICYYRHNWIGVMNLLTGNGWSLRLFCRRWARFSIALVMTLTQSCGCGVLSTKIWGAISVSWSKTVIWMAPAGSPSPGNTTIRAMWSRSIWFLYCNVDLLDCLLDKVEVDGLASTIMSLNKIIVRGSKRVGGWCKIKRRWALMVKGAPVNAWCTSTTWSMLSIDCNLGIKIVPMSASLVIFTRV